MDLRRPVTKHAVPPSGEICRLRAVELVAAIKARKLSVREVATAFLNRIEAVNPAVNAIVSLRERGAVLREAEAADALLSKNPETAGNLFGLPVAVKDLARTKGLKTTYGSPIFADFVPDEDEFFVGRMRAAGAIVIGKTNAPEFGLGSNTYNPVFGATLNAFDPHWTAGGSSGGAAVALALDMVPVADGSDFGGSLRNPAAYNNVYGFRPSPGPGGRVAWLGDLGGALPMEDGVLAVCEEALGRLGDAGFTVDAFVPGFDFEALWQAFVTLRQATSGCALKLHADDPARRSLLKPEALWEAENAARLTALEIHAAATVRTAWHRALLEVFGRFDLLAVPTAQVFPFAVGTHWPQRIAGRAMDSYHRWMQVASLASMGGCPTASVPAGFDAQGRPMGLQLIGRPRGDLAVLRAAAAYEAVLPWTPGAGPA